MTDAVHQSSFIAKLVAVGEAAGPAKIKVEFRYAADPPAVGQPGSQAGDMLVFPREEGSHLVVVSLGKAEKASAEMARRAGGALGKWLLTASVDVIAVTLDTVQQIEGGTKSVLEGICLGAYSFKRYKKANDSIKTVTVHVQGADPELVAQVQAVCDAVILARDLAHEPANVINPFSLAERTREVAEASGLGFRVIDAAELANMGAGAILGVGQGSQTPPCLIVMEYAGDGSSRQPVVLVGKAITFDTGGYSIKNTEGIVGMKYDKCGGVDVIATMQAAAALKVSTPVVGIIAAAENMISDEAYRPDDILTSMSGKTIEIISTDAEGRLVLADALTYAQREYQPRAVIDLATLTGGVIVALGRVRAALLSNNDDLAQALFNAGEKTYERLWRMPLDEDYSRAMKGDDADLKNSGGREGHCILGGAFIKEFVQADVPWAHLDIAGVAETNKELPYSPKGATGFGIRLLVEYLQGLR